VTRWILALVLGACGTESADDIDGMSDAGGGDASPDAGISPLDRSEVDRADDVAGYQVHVIYAVPSDGPDLERDTSGAVERSFSAINDWLAGETGGPRLRVDTFDGRIDVTFVRLPASNAHILSCGPYVRETLERQLVAVGFDAPEKLYAVYYDGQSSYACGGGPWPATVPGHVAAIYLDGLSTGEDCATAPLQCKCNSVGEGTRYFEYAILHEIVHGLGVAATAAPHEHASGHVFDPGAIDPARDLMYSPRVDHPEDPYWGIYDGLLLDVGRDDYYGHDGAFVDLADSIFLEPSPPAPTLPASWDTPAYVAPCDG
jgi:hypothetical protein